MLYVYGAVIESVSIVVSFIIKISLEVSNLYMYGTQINN